MLEIERYISSGRNIAFFRIREDHSIGVMIHFRLEGDNARDNLQKELNKAVVLRKLGVSVLDYKDVMLIKIPEHVEKTFERASIDMASNGSWYEKMKKYFIDHKGITVWGLVVEYIPDDIIPLQSRNLHTLVSRNRIEYIYNKEREKIEQFGISLSDSDSEGNIIWSESRAKLYFIDFESWNFEYLRKKYIKLINKDKIVKEQNNKMKKGLFSFLFRR
jgi:hypothetical protein